MSGEERCELTELIKSQCEHCVAAARVKPVDPDAVTATFNFRSPASRFLENSSGPWFPANYQGECSECGLHFYEGEIIQADGAGGWRLKECCGTD